MGARGAGGRAMVIKLYVEGGGDSKELHVRCREGYRKLIEKAGFQGRTPRIVACGGRNATYDSFTTAVAGQEDYPLLLVDSEDPAAPAEDPNSDLAWQHLRRRDGWDHPVGAVNDQAQLMATCMETWSMADRAAMRNVFGAALQENALLTELDLEQRDRHVVQDTLERATRNCGRDKAYQKGRRSFQALAALSPATLTQYLPYFRRFIATLKRHL